MKMFPPHIYPYRVEAIWFEARPEGLYETVYAVVHHSPTRKTKFQTSTYVAPLPGPGGSAIAEPTDGERP